MNYIRFSVGKLRAELPHRFHLISQNFDVLLDDRAQRAGVKFKDADLIGFPLRVVIGGKGLQEGLIELKWRTAAEPIKVPVADAVATIWN